MRDLFVRWATRATGATESGSVSDRSGFPGAAVAAQRSDARATRATDTPTAGDCVAHVAHGSSTSANSGNVEKSKQDKDDSAVLPVLPMLPTETGEPERLATHKPPLVRLLSLPGLDAEAGELAAVKRRNTIIGDVWLVADAEALAEHPDIIRAGLPVLFFDELEQLRGKTLAELRAIGMVKATFPTSRVLQ